MRVLVVESQGARAAHMRRVLLEVGFEVDVAASGAKALAAARDRSRPLHVVVVSRDLPDMSGDEVVLELGSIRRETAVIIASPNGEVELPHCDARISNPAVTRDLVQAATVAVAARAVQRLHGARRTAVCGRSH